MRKTWTVLLLIISAAIGFGQETPKSNQPDLSGTWVLDMDRSDLAGPKSGLIYDSLTLIIEHREPEIKITRKLVKDRKETVHALTGLDHRFGHGAAIHRRGAESAEVSQKRRESSPLLLCVVSAFSAPLR
ncbi:MAG: hypothetical protein L0220_30155 [Acidobacteria bacterium]|nr:hypothetical protein [Acidobacteriota bacterium]